jgi:hypothetical protein
MHRVKLVLTKRFIFWDITPCSPLNGNRSFGGACRLQNPLCLLPASSWFLAWFILRPWTCSSETSADFQRTKRHYIAEDRCLHNHRYENLKSYLSSYSLLNYKTVAHLLVLRNVVKLGPLVVWPQMGRLYQPLMTDATNSHSKRCWTCSMHLIPSQSISQTRLLGRTAMKPGRSLPTFYRNLLPPSLVYKIKAIGSSETTVVFYQITQRHVPDDSYLQNHCCENLKFHVFPKDPP